MHDPNMEYRNTWGEERRLIDIATWDDQSVLSEAAKLNSRLKDDELVPRQRLVVERLAELVAFEIKFRGNEIEALEGQFEISRAEV